MAGLLFCLFLSWGSRCWDRFAIDSFCYAGKPQLELGYLCNCWQGSGVLLHGLQSYATKSDA